MQVTRVNSNYFNNFPPEVFSKDKLTSEVMAVITALKNLELLSQEDFNLLKSSKPLVTKKREFIREIAVGLSILVLNEKLIKKCLGHDIRISWERMKKKKAEKFYSNELEVYYQQDPSIKKLSPYIQKPEGRSKYDVRLKFSHYDNAPECTYPAEAKSEMTQRAVLDVLDSFEASLAKENFDMELAYSNILDKVFED